MIAVPAASLACCGAYLLFAGTVSASELGTAAVLGLLGGCWAHVARRVSERRFRFSIRHLVPWLRAIGSVPVAAARTGPWLLRAAVSGGCRGRADEAGFRSGSDADPADQARRATALLAASLAPESYVVRAEAGSETVLFHAIDGKPKPVDREWLA